MGSKTPGVGPHELENTINLDKLSANKFVVGSYYIQKLDVVSSPEY
jgi:hypothetical protein